MNNLPKPQGCFTKIISLAIIQRILLRCHITTEDMAKSDRLQTMHFACIMQCMHVKGFEYLALEGGVGWIVSWLIDKCKICVWFCDDTLTRNHLQMFASALVLYNQLSCKKSVLVDTGLLLIQIQISRCQWTCHLCVNQREGQPPLQLAAI